MTQLFLRRLLDIIGSMGLLSIGAWVAGTMLLWDGGGGGAVVSVVVAALLIRRLRGQWTERQLASNES